MGNQNFRGWPAEMRVAQWYPKSLQHIETTVAARQNKKSTEDKYSEDSVEFKRTKDGEMAKSWAADVEIKVRCYRPKSMSDKEALIFNIELWMSNIVEWTGIKGFVGVSQLSLSLFYINFSLL